MAPLSSHVHRQSQCLRAAGPRWWQFIRTRLDGRASEDVEMVTMMQGSQSASTSVWRQSFGARARGLVNLFCGPAPKSGRINSSPGRVEQHLDVGARSDRSSDSSTVLIRRWRSNQRMEWAAEAFADHPLFFCWDESAQILMKDNQLKTSRKERKMFSTINANRDGRNLGFHSHIRPARSSQVRCRASRGLLGSAASG